VHHFLFFFGIHLVGFLEEGISFECYLNSVLTQWYLLSFPCSVGGERGETRSSNVVRSGATQKVLPIEIPALPLNELNRLTGNFGSKALIGEGSYGRVFYARLSTGQEAAVKKLDTSASQEPDSDFAAQVSLPCPKLYLIESDPCNIVTQQVDCVMHLFSQLSTVSRLKNEHFVELIGYCLEANNRILVHEFATMGSLHDVLHGMTNKTWGIFQTCFEKNVSVMYLCRCRKEGCAGC